MEQSAQSQTMERPVIGTLSVVRKFRRLIEGRNMALLNKELYQFLNLYCGFIAHYNIQGFRDAYAAPRDFADVFIRHFDRDHRYFRGNYRCHDEPYQDTGFTKAEIKEEFFHIADQHKETIRQWAVGQLKDHRYAAYLALKAEFEPEESRIRFRCDLCGESFDVEMSIQNGTCHIKGQLCCPSCGQQIQAHEGGENHVERTIERETGENTEAL